MSKPEKDIESQTATAAGLKDTGWPAAVGILAGLVLLLFGDLFLGGSARVAAHPLTDLTGYFIFAREFGFRQLADGNLALWNPHLFCGLPFFGGWQSALLYPLNWIYLILPLGAALNLEITAHVFLAGFFTLLWTHRRCGSWLGGTLAGALAMLGGANYLHVYAGHLTFVDATAWVPLILLIVDLVLEKSSIAAAWAGAGIVAMQVYAGHPQTVYATALAATCYLSVLLPEADRRWRAMGLFAGMYGFGVLIGAWQLSAAVDAASESTRGGALDYGEAAAFSLPIENLMTTITPWIFGKNLQAEQLWGGVYAGQYYMWEMCVYIGVAGLFLAALGVVRGRGAFRFKVLGLGLFFVLLALGENTPLHRLLYHVLPGFDRFRGSSKFFSEAQFFIAMLAALGWSELARAKESRGKIAIALGSIGTLCSVGALMIASTDVWQAALAAVQSSGKSYLAPTLFHDEAFVASAARQAAISLFMAGLGFASIAFLVALSARRSRARYGVPCLLLLDLFVFARMARPTFELKEALHPNGIADVKAGIQANERVVFAGGNENAAMSNDLYSLWGYDPQVNRRYAEWMFFSQDRNPDEASYMLQISRMGRLFEQMRCSRVVATKDGVAELRGEIRSWKRAFVTSRFEVVEGRDALLRRAAGEAFGEGQTVFVEADPKLANPMNSSAADVSVEGSSSDATDAMILDVTVAAPALLVVTDAYSKGWRAFSSTDSRMKYPILPVNYALVGIPLKAGTHSITLEYAPLRIEIGKWITCAAVFCWCCGGLWLLVRNRRLRKPA